MRNIEKMNKGKKVASHTFRKHYDKANKPHRGTGNYKGLFFNVQDSELGMFN